MKKLLITLLLLISVAYGQTFWVAPGGNNGNPGTEAQPWADIVYACDNVTTPGAIIRVRAGTYVMNNAFPTSLAVGVSLIGDGYNSTIIRSTLTTPAYAMFNMLSPQGTLGNQRISGIQFDGQNATDLAFFIMGRGRVEIDNCWFRNFVSNGLFLYGHAVGDNTTVPPTIYASKNSFHDNIMDNSASWGGSSGNGALNYSGQDSMAIYNNVISQTQRPNGQNGFCVKGDWSFRTIMHANTFNKFPLADSTAPGTTSWDFSVELWHHGSGSRIFNNKFIGGALDMDGLNNIRDSAYSMRVYNNEFFNPNLSIYFETGIYLENDVRKVLIENNVIYNKSRGIFFTTRFSRTARDVIIRNNLLYNIGRQGGDGKIIQFGGNNTAKVVRNIQIDNNTMISAVNSAAPLQGIFFQVETGATYDSIYIRNNILQGAQFTIDGAEGQQNRYFIQNNNFFNNGNSNNPSWGGIPPTNLVYSGNITTNPTFVAGNSYALASGSPAINAGLNIGLPFVGAAPDIGYWESGYKLPITPQSEIVDMNAARNVRLARLFDGDVNNGGLQESVNSPSPRIDVSKGNPFEGRVYLDSIYNISSLRYWAGTSGLNPNQGHKILFYDSNRVQIGDTVLAGYAGFGGWVNVPFAPRANVRYIRFTYAHEPTITAYLGNNYPELEFFGQAVSVANSILPATSTTSAPDLGADFFGLGGISDMVDKYTVGNTADTIWKRYRSLRTFNFGWFQDHTTGSSSLATISLNLLRFGTDYEANRLVKFAASSRNMMWNISGPSIQKAVSPSATGFMSSDTAYKWVDRTVQGLAAQDYRWLGQKWGRIAALYGSNASAQLDASRVIGGSTTRGRNLIQRFEIENEPDRFWPDGNYYHNPQQFYWTSRTVSDSIRSKDGNAVIHAGALTSIDTMYWKAVYYYGWEETGSRLPLPNIAAFNFNQYINDALTQRQGTVGWTGEQWNLSGRLTGLTSFMRKYWPGKYVAWTENGYTTNESSSYNVPTIAGVTHERTQVNWTVRNIAISQTSPIMSHYYYYKFSNDGTPEFGTMGATVDTFNAVPGAYIGSRVTPIGYAYAQNIYIERNFQKNATLLTAGDSTGIWVTRKSNGGNNRIYKVWRGTRNNSISSNYILDVGTATGTAKVFTDRLDRWEPDSTSIPVINGAVTIPTVSERMLWVEVTETGGAAASASAGPDRSVTLPQSTTTLSGSGSGTAPITYSWAKISGPAGGTIVSPTSATTGITGLQAGLYIFRLTATNGLGSSTDDVNVVVNAEGNTTISANCNINLSTASIFRQTTVTIGGISYRQRLYACGSSIVAVHHRWIGGRWVLVNLIQ